MSGALRKTALFAGGILALVVLVLAAAFLFIQLNPSWVRGRVEKTLQGRFGPSVSIKRLEYRLFPLHIHVEEARIIQRNDLGLVELKIGVLEAAGKIIPLLRGKKPALSNVALSGVGLDFTLNPDATPGDLPDLETLLRGTADVLDLAKNYILRGELRVLSRDFRLTLAGTVIEITRRDAGSWRLALECGEIEARHTPRQLILRSRLRMEAGIRAGERAGIEGDLSLSGAAGEWGARSFTMEEDGFNCFVGYRSSGREITLSRLDIHIPRLVRMTGMGRIALDKTAAADLTAEFRLSDLAALLEKAGPLAPLPQGMRLSGTASATFGYRLRESRHSVDAALTSGGMGFSLPYGGHTLEGVASVSAKIEDFPAQIRVSGRLESQLNTLIQDSIKVGRPLIRTSFLLQNHRLEMADLWISLAESGWASSAGPVGFTKMDLRAGLVMDLAAGTAKAEGISLEIPDLPTITGAARFNLKPAPWGEIWMESGEAEIPSLLKLAPEGLRSGLSSWEPAGRLRMKFTASKPSSPQSPLRLGLQAGLSGLSFHSPSFDKAAESIGMTLHLDADLRVPEGAEGTPFRLEAGIPEGEILWSSTYINWGKNPLSLSCSGHVGIESATLRADSLQLGFPPLGTVTGELSLSGADGPEVSLGLRAGDLDLDRILRFYFGQKGETESPLSIKGESALAVDLFWSGSELYAEGEYRLTSGSISSAQGGLKGRGVEAAIPFSLSLGGSRGDGWFSRTGLITAEEIVTGIGTFQRPVLEFLAAPNLFLIAPIAMDLFGGRAHFGGTVLSLPLLKGGFRGRSSLVIEGLDLSGIPTENPDFRLEGTLKAVLSSLSFFPDRISTTGVVSAQVFGGMMRMADPAVERPFHAGRTLKGDVSITGLDLKKLTDSIPFGQVTGLVNIDIKDFSLSYGQPEAFVLTIKSVKKKGVAQKFSLKAVDDLTILSSGTRSQSQSARLLTAFVSSFNYDRIGISCSLENDIFTLRGTIVEKGREFLVRRARIFGIDVVNAKPNNRISFKDMLGRLRQIGQSQGTR